MFAPKYYKDRMYTIIEYEEEASAVSRLDLWKAGIQMWSKSPLWGVGPANFPLLSPDYVKWRANRTNQGLQAHNMYIEFLAEVGVQGLMLFLFLLISTLISLKKSSTVSKSLTFTELELSRIGLRDGIMNYFLFAMFGPVFFRDIFFYYLGCASVLPIIRKDHIDQE